MKKSTIFLTCLVVGGLAMVSSVNAENGFIHGQGQNSAHHADSVTVDPFSYVYFSSGYTPDSQEAGAETDHPNPWGNTETQTLSVISKLQKNLSTVNLGFGDVIQVRAYIGKDTHKNLFDFEGFDAAFDATFGTAEMPNKPVLSKVGIVGVRQEHQLVEIEMVAVHPPGQKATEDNTYYNNTNPMLIPTINSADSPNSLGTAVNPNASWFFTAGHTGTLEGSDAASADLYAHSVAAFEELQDTLNQQGLTFADVFSVRAMVFSNADGSYSYDGFDRAYGEYFSSPQNPNKPALTTFTVGEGFRSYGLKLEIEVMAAFPDISGPFNHYDVNSQNKMIRTSGPEELTYRKGVAVARHANYTWFSAVTSDGNGTLEQQSRQVFTHLDGQLKRLGLGWDSVVAIRSYFNTDLSVEEMFKAHRPVRQMYMNNEENPHKPAGTSLKVAGLPNNAALAIELVVIKNQ